MLTATAASRRFKEPNSFTLSKGPDDRETDVSSETGVCGEVSRK